MSIRLTSLIAVVVCSILLATTQASVAAEKSVDTAKEQAALMKALEAEWAAATSDDLARWSEGWVHAPYVRRLGSSPKVTNTAGWDAILAAKKKAIAAKPSGAPNALGLDPKVARENFNFRIYRDAAWVTFDQHSIWEGKPYVSRETRIFEKHDGKWKVVYLGFIYEPENAQGKPTN